MIAHGRFQSSTSASCSKYDENRRNISRLRNLNRSRLSTSERLRTKIMTEMGKKGGAFLKEFAPEPTEDERKQKEDRAKAEELARTGGYPELLKNSKDKVFNVNVMVKNKGFGVLWNGVGTLTIPDTGVKEQSVNLARVVCVQRREMLYKNFERLYPKMAKAKFPLEWAIQPFEDPYADPLDLDGMVLDSNYVSEMVPGNFQFLRKGKAVGPGA
jgi:hypothetical protein